MPTQTESWMQDQRQAGNSIAGSGDGYAVAVMDATEDDYIVLYDLSDGHPLRVPAQDRIYMLAKRRATQPGERALWVTAPGIRGKFQHAPGGSVPAYSETPPATLQPVRNQPVAQTDGDKTVRRSRKRGRRGRGKGSS